MFWKKNTDNSKEQIEKFFQHRGYTPMGDFSEKDVFIAGFPKSGNTWMQHLITGLNYNVDMSAVSNMLVRDLVPDVHQGNFYKRYQERMFFKTHFLPKEEYRNAIFLVRDPRDAINSFWHMETGMGKETTIKEIVEQNKGLYNSWSEHVETWIKNPYRANIITVKYEDIIGNPLAVVRQIMQAFDLKADDEMVNKIIANCAFDKMREKENSALWGKNKAWKEGKYFVRKGKAGAFKDELKEDEIRLIEQKFAESMKKFNYSI